MQSELKESKGSKYRAWLATATNRLTSRLGLWDVLWLIGVLWMAMLVLLPFIPLLAHAQSAAGVIADLGEAQREINRTEFWNAVKTSAIYAAFGALGAVTLALPVAIALTAAEKHSVKLWAVFILAPLFVNVLLRAYALRWLCMGDGVIASLASCLGYDGPLIGSQAIVVVGMIYLYLPYAVIPLAVSISRIDGAVVDAAETVGLRGARLTWVAAGPALIKGLIAAFLLTFVPAFGDYLAPVTLGGSKVYLIATYLYDEAVLADNMKTAAVCLVTLWVVSGFLYWAFGKISPFYTYLRKKIVSKGRHHA